jgi:hypothetical protein
MTKRNVIARSPEYSGRRRNPVPSDCHTERKRSIPRSAEWTLLSKTGAVILGIATTCGLTMDKQSGTNSF